MSTKEVAGDSNEALGTEMVAAMPVKESAKTASPGSAFMESLIIVCGQNRDGKAPSPEWVKDLRGSRSPRPFAASEIKNAQGKRPPLPSPLLQRRRGRRPEAKSAGVWLDAVLMGTMEARAKASSPQPSPPKEEREKTAALFPKGLRPCPAYGIGFAPVKG